MARRRVPYATSVVHSCILLFVESQTRNGNRSRHLCCDCCSGLSSRCPLLSSADSYFRPTGGKQLLRNLVAIFIRSPLVSSRSILNCGYGHCNHRWSCRIFVAKPQWLLERRLTSLNGQPRTVLLRVGRIVIVANCIFISVGNLDC